MSHVFISYSHADTDFVRQLAADLEKLGFAVWYDNNLKPGVSWSEEINEAIETSTAFIVVMTSKAEQSEAVKNEIQTALASKTQIFPLLLSGRAFEQLKHIQYIDVHDNRPVPQSFYAELERFVRRTTSPLIAEFAAALINEKGFERQPPSKKFSQLEPAALLLREHNMDINAFALIRADGLTEPEIVHLHQTFFQYLSDWRPAFFLKRALGKTGVLGFIFENGCTQETVNHVLMQKAATEESGLVLTDGTRTVSWAIDVEASKVYSYEIILPSLLPQAAYFYPGKEWVEQFLQAKNL